MPTWSRARSAGTSSRCPATSTSIASSSVPCTRPGTRLAWPRKLATNDVRAGRRARPAAPSARSGPAFITATVSAIVMASSWSWVTWMKVQPDLGLDALELDLHLATQLEVERAERLVEQQHLGAVDHGAGQRDPLLLAPGELGRLAAGEVRSSAPGRARSAASVAAALSPRRGPEGHVVGDVEVREEGVALEDGVDRPLVGPRPGEVVSPMSTRPAVGLLEPGDHPQRRGLAAARRPEQGEERPAGHDEVELVAPRRSPRSAW